MTWEIKGSTTVCAVIGDPIEHTLSPCMHNAAFKSLGLNYVYVAFHAKDIAQAMNGMRGFNIRGLSVTIPHKVSVMGHLDEVTPLAKRIGAVNTVINDNGHLVGTNTDGIGALNAIEQYERVDGKTVVFLGVGGAARGVGFTLACERKPKQIYFLHRDEDAEMASALTSEMRSHSSSLISTGSLNQEDMKQAFESANVIINTTPIGMAPNVDQCLVDESLFSEQHLVFDIIYNPAQTLLLKRAESRFARTINGVPMFVNQGAEQFRLWTGEKPPVDVMAKVVKEALGQA
ncbi:MAG: shikimate dehydrogenase [Candidatus Hinthialibacter antarcticus]|nr:shikimate dehydrogenase [Candidatus Hinthialibacter antarcticus]